MTFYNPRLEAHPFWLGIFLWEKEKGDAMPYSGTREEINKKTREYYYRHMNTAGGRAARLASRRKWSKNNPEKLRASWRRSDFRKYGITEKHYRDIYEKQQGKCGICGKSKLPRLSTGAKKEDVLCIDHCHKSGKNRGLVCNKCNFVLGHADDDPSVLEKAAIYLRKFYAGVEMSGGVDARCT